MRWKVFFWILAFLTITGLFAEIKHGHINYFEDVINNVFDLLLLIGLGSYAYKKIIFPPRVWQIVLILFVCNYLILVFFHNVIPTTNILRSKPAMERLITDILLFPLLFFQIFAVFKLGFNAKIYKQQKFTNW